MSLGLLDYMHRQPEIELVDGIVHGPIVAPLWPHRKKQQTPTKSLDTTGYWGKSQMPRVPCLIIDKPKGQRRLRRHWPAARYLEAGGADHHAHEEADPSFRHDEIEGKAKPGRRA